MQQFHKLKIKVPDIDSEMKMLFDAAAILTQSMRKGKKWKLTRSFDNISDPTELARLAE